MISTVILKKYRTRVRIFTLILLGLFFLSSNSIKAQRVSIATNLVNYLNFGTVNAEVGVGISQHLSLYIQGKYNPFEYTINSKQINNRQASVTVGARYWPWHAYSGWFASLQAGFTRYNRGGIISQDTYEGDAYGITLAGGYALMINEHLNIDFGAGIIGGFTDYVKYACPSCGNTLEKDKKIFIAPNSVLVQLSYLF